MNAGPDFATELMLRLLWKIPDLVVLMIALALAFRYIGRCKVPAILTMISVLVLVFTTLATSSWQVWIIETQLRGGGNKTWMFTANSILGTVGHTIGMLLLISAIFIGRRRWYSNDDSE